MPVPVIDDVLLELFTLTPDTTSQLPFLFARNRVPLLFSHASSRLASAGYMHEHTERETAQYVSTYQTFKLIESVLHHQLIVIREEEALHVARA